MVMRCWLLPGGESFESMTVLGVTPLALWGSAQVLMVLTSSSWERRRRENILHNPRKAPHVSKCVDTPQEAPSGVTEPPQSRSPAARRRAATAPHRTAPVDSLPAPTLTSTCHALRPRPLASPPPPDSHPTLTAASATRHRAHAREAAAATAA